VFKPPERQKLRESKLNRKGGKQERGWKKRTNVCWPPRGKTHLKEACICVIKQKLEGGVRKEKKRKA